MTRYYSTQRPVGLGTYPKQRGNKVLNIVNYDDRIYCKEIDRKAWGYIEYEKPLDEMTAYNYDLVKGGE